MIGNHNKIGRAVTATNSSMSTHNHGAWPIRPGRLGAPDAGAVRHGEYGRRRHVIARMRPTAAFLDLRQLRVARAIRHNYGIRYPGFEKYQLPGRPDVRQLHGRLEASNIVRAFPESLPARNHGYILQQLLANILQFRDAESVGNNHVRPPPLQKRPMQQRFHVRNPPVRYRQFPAACSLFEQAAYAILGAALRHRERVPALGQSVQQAGFRPEARHSRKRELAAEIDAPNHRPVRSGRAPDHGLSTFGRAAEERRS